MTTDATEATPRTTGSSARPRLQTRYREEIIPPGNLPLRLVAHTPCFRREKMSAGRDVRGIKRGHQFEKVEMFVYCEPEQGEAEFQGLLSRARLIPDQTRPQASPGPYCAPRLVR